MKNDTLLDIYSLWRSPFTESFKDLVQNIKCLSLHQKDLLLKLEQLYISEEALSRKDTSEFYHTHGVLSASVVMYTIKANPKIESLDCFSLIAAALLHDFNGFVSKEKKFAEAMDLLESKGLVELLGLKALDSIEALLQYTSYDKGRPINWGSSLLDGPANEVIIEKDIPVEGLLVSYGDILGQLCSPDYLTRAGELLKILDIVDTDFIPLKLLILADKIVLELEKRATIVMPEEIKEGILKNTQKARLRYDFQFHFE